MRSDYEHDPWGGPKYTHEARFSGALGCRGVWIVTQQAHAEIIHPPFECSMECSCLPGIDAHDTRGNLGSKISDLCELNACANGNPRSSSDPN